MCLPRELLTGSSKRHNRNLGIPRESIFNAHTPECFFFLIISPNESEILNGNLAAEGLEVFNCLDTHQSKF